MLHRQRDSSPGGGEGGGAGPSLGVTRQPNLQAHVISSKPNSLPKLVTDTLSPGNPASE